MAKFICTVNTWQTSMTTKVCLTFSMSANFVFSQLFIVNYTSIQCQGQVTGTRGIKANATLPRPRTRIILPQRPASVRATSNVDQGRFMRRQYRGLRTSATVLFAFVVAWFPYCVFLSTIFILITVDTHSTNQHISISTTLLVADSPAWSSLGN